MTRQDKVIGLEYKDRLISSAHKITLDWMLRLLRPFNKADTVLLELASCYSFIFVLLIKFSHYTYSQFIVLNSHDKILALIILLITFEVDCTELCFFKGCEVFRDCESIKPKPPQIGFHRVFRDRAPFELVLTWR